jgi:hypothetical protein
MVDSAPPERSGPPAATTSTTVRDIFALPEPGKTEDAPAGWSAFQEKMSKEVKGIKTAAMPDLVKKMGELFDIPIPNIFLTSWQKANVLHDLLEESKKTPEKVMELELGEHTINSQHKPHIEVRIQNTKVKELEFVLRLVFKVKGFVLKIQDGAIKEMRVGSCEARGTMEYQGLIIAEKKLAPIQLPVLVSFESTKAEAHNSVVPPAVESEKEYKLVEAARAVAENINASASEVTKTKETEGVRTMTGSGSA